MAQAGYKSATRQQLIELLGFTRFLKQRQLFLDRKSRSALASQSDLEELAQVEELLAPSPEPIEKFFPHKNEAGRRIAAVIKAGGTPTRADKLQADAMSEYPEVAFGSPIARRLAHLSLLIQSGLGKEEEQAELEQLRDWRPAVGA